MSTIEENLTPWEYSVAKVDRASIKKQRPCLIWLTGLSGAGKSALANALDHRLFHSHLHSYVLDGDNIRSGLNRDLGFSDADRTENIRRIGEVSKLFVDSGLIVIAAFISPFRADREMVRQLFSDQEFMEVYIDAPLDVCESRDTKGLYKKARSGDLQNFTGITSPYEMPLNPELILHTHIKTLAECVDEVFNLLWSEGYIEIDK
jgi:adenylylsulfate kinase